jgi:2-hydroxy-3-keto-5-methylthiopentenyl-1-phosphate phosphatase
MQMIENKYIINGTNCEVFFDFDNTVTLFDILDDLIERYAVSKDWYKFEMLWQAGKIGSLECLSRQLELIRISKKDFDDYVLGIPIDPGFKLLLSYFRSKGIEPVIVSDGFTGIISKVLENHSISGIKILANGLEHEEDRFKLTFPYVNKECDRCAHCKQNNVIKNESSKKMIVYIGDGLSDVCPAEQCDIVFAKASLLKHFKHNKLEHIEFNKLIDIYNFFQEVDNGA